jgi:hypothetical protein
MCKRYGGSYFRRTVGYLVKRGESLNVSREPAGTALHAPLWEISVGVLWRYEILLKKGADPNVPGPAGTPLRLAWKRALSGKLPTSQLEDYQALMKLLLNYGAVIGWVDEDGVAPTEKEIRAIATWGLRNLRSPASNLSGGFVRCSLAEKSAISNTLKEICA